MAAPHHTDPTQYLGHQVCIVDTHRGVPIEIRGTVTGIFRTQPGSIAAASVFLESPTMPDGEFFSLEDITIHIE